MKYCKAWPEACVGKVIQSTDSNSTGTGIVVPKSVVDSTVDRVVERTVSALVKESFGTFDTEEDPESSGPPSARSKSLPELDDEPRNDLHKSSTTRSVGGVTDWSIWIALGLLAIVSLVTIQGLVARVDSLESWLHGRLAARP